MLRFWPGSERQRQKLEKGSIGPCCLRPQTGIKGKAILPISLAWLKREACLPTGGPLARQLA